MKILLITFYGPSLTNFRWPLVRDLVGAGHHAVAAAPGIPDDVRMRLAEIGVVVEESAMSRTGLNPMQDLAYLFGIIRLIRRHRPDLLLSFTIKPNIWGAFAAALERVPSVAVLTGLGYAFTRSESYKQKMAGYVAARLYRLATRFNRRVVFQNPDDRDDFVAAGGLADPHKAVVVNGSGVDLSHYARAPLPEDAVFLMVSRLLGNKGVREYAAAAASVKKDLPSARFLLVGDWDEGHDGVSQHEVEAWTSAGLEYCGAMLDVRPAIAEASVFVLPSYREGTPRSVLEAMAMGRPIITTDAPGCRETVQDGKNGYLVPPRNVPDLAHRMLDLAENPDRRAIFGDKSHDLAKSRYDVSKVNRELISVLEGSR